MTAKKGGASKAVIATPATQEKCARRPAINGFLMKAAHKNRAVTQFLLKSLYLKQLLSLSHPLMSS
jgi:hypothetical protein